MTRVGKVGYAPPEQLQAGRVYPNSDLYSLAASSLVLLTGQEPRKLLDGQTLTWQWQSYTSTSPALTRILQRMLAIYPSDRYQSATEVLADLQSLLTTTLEESEIPSHPSPVAAPAKLLLPPLPHQPARASHGSNSTTFSYPEQNGKSASKPLFCSAGKRSSGIRPGIKLGIAAAVVISLGIAAPLLWETWTSSSRQNRDVWVSGAKLPQSEVSRIIGSQRVNASNSAMRSPAIVPLNNGQPQTIQFPAGEISTTLAGTLRDNTPQTYVLEAVQGQIMIASLEGAEVTMNLLRSNQEAIDGAAYRTRSWTGYLPASDRYLIQVAGSGDYSLEIAVTPLSRPTQEQTQRVSFARGTTGTTVTGQLALNQIRRYLLRAEEGQILVLKTLQGNASFSVIAPDGQRIGGSATNAKNWQGRIPLGGDYVIEVSTRKTESFALSIEIF
jgi:serine/threonine-protein kinase